MTNLSCYHAVKRTGNDSTRAPPAASYINAVFLGDRSGSMATMGTVPQEGVADFLKKHKELADKNPDSEIVVTVVTFDNCSKVAYYGQAKNITEEDIIRAKHDMTPRATTRLIDTAIEQIEKQAKGISAARRRWKKTGARSGISGEVLRLEPIMASSFTLLTDGDDNESRRTSRDLNRAIKEHQYKNKTVCLFAAANQDAMTSGARYGFQNDRSLQIGTDINEARSAFDSCKAAAVRSATQQSANYTQVERNASCAFGVSDYDGDAQLLDDNDDYIDCNGASLPVSRC